MPCYAQDDLSKYQTQLKALVTELKKTQAKVEKETAKQTSIEKKIKKAEINIAELAATERSLIKKRQVLQNKLEDNEQKILELYQSEKEQFALLSKQLVSIYKNGTPSLLQQLLENKNPATIDRNMTYFAAINKARTELIEEYRQTQKSIAQLSEKIILQEEELADNQSAINRQQLALNQAQDSRLEILKKLKQSISKSRSQAEKLDQNKQALTFLINEITEVTSEIPVQTQKSLQQEWKSFASAKGNLPWPVDGKHSNLFGQKRGKNNLWQGITISSNAGKPVKAIYPGTVLFSNWFKGQGLLMIVDHGNDYLSLYAHNQTLLRPVGATVNKGDVIATVGNSGAQEKNALYFEIRYKGKPENPKKWCKS